MDTRFSYCALSTLAILGKLPSATGANDAAAAGEAPAPIIDVAAATAFVGRCVSSYSHTFTPHHRRFFT